MQVSCASCLVGYPTLRFVGVGFRRDQVPSNLAELFQSRLKIFHDLGGAIVRWGVNSRSLRGSAAGSPKKAGENLAVFRNRSPTKNVVAHLGATDALTKAIHEQWYAARTRGSLGGLGRSFGEVTDRFAELSTGAP